MKIKQEKTVSPWEKLHVTAAAICEDTTHPVRRLSHKTVYVLHLHSNGKCSNEWEWGTAQKLSCFVIPFAQNFGDIDYIY